jgi:hypothetical protein
MTKPRRPWTPLAAIWLSLAILGLIGTWTFNVLAVIAMRNYIGDWVGSGPAVTSLTIDLLVTAVAASIFMIVEARRLGMRLGWLYVVGAGFTALAFTFPLFLSNRERTLAARREDGTHNAKNAG